MNCNIKNKHELRKKVRETHVVLPDFVIYTDGSVGKVRGEGTGASAFVILSSDEKDVILESFSCHDRTTNNRMELNAIVNAVRYVPERSTVLIVTDSKYAISVLSSTEKEFEKNTEYINEFRNIVRESELRVRFQWKRGHKSDFWNNYVDNLANEARKNYIAS